MPTQRLRQYEVFTRHEIKTKWIFGIRIGNVRHTHTIHRVLHLSLFVPAIHLFLFSRFPHFLPLFVLHLFLKLKHFGKSIDYRLSGSLESKNRHEVREAFDVTSIDGFFPDGHLPEFRTAVGQLLPQLCKLSNRLLTCLAIGLGTSIRNFPAFSALSAKFPQKFSRRIDFHPFPANQIPHFSFEKLKVWRRISLRNGTG